jgi:hypothetical protein
MSLETPERIRSLQKKLYLKAKAERHRVPSRGTRRFSREIVFGELGILSLRAQQAVRQQPWVLR